MFAGFYDDVVKKSLKENKILGREVTHYIDGARII